MPSKVKGEPAWPFPHMMVMPWPYLLILPIVYALCAGFGWSQDDYVEQEVSEIWIPTKGDFAQDKAYADSLGEDRASSSSIAAMAIARDGKNLFRESRLEEIRQRMEAAESTTIEWKGETITYADICASNNVGLGTTYEFPCARLTPMDFFKEARWFFDENDKVTWRNDVIRQSIVKPILPRFGIMSQYCAPTAENPTQTQCLHQISLRNSADYAEKEGYDRSYANPLNLLSDIASLEMNDECKMCIEDNFQVQLDTLTLATKGSFGVMAQSIQALLMSGAVTDPAKAADLTTRAGQYGQLAQGLTRADIEEFFTYYTTRGLYAELNMDSYIDGYEYLVSLLRPGCLAEQATNPSLICPNPTVTQAEAAAAMTNHADGPFSSFNTAGHPFPWWSDATGTGKLFEGTSGVSGSGIDLTGTLLSMSAYVDIATISDPANWNPIFVQTGGFPDTTSDPAWIGYVESDPVYKWFMASFEPADETCVNNALTGSQTGNPQYDGLTAVVMGGASQSWCTKFDIPNAEDAGVEGSYTKQHFAVMWYDLFIDEFLSLKQGVDDPFSWTLGQGCGYSLTGERSPYTNVTETDILSEASRVLYYIDEGTSVGPIDQNLLLGGTEPAVNEVSVDNPWKKISVVQSLYVATVPKNMVKRVQNCNRPGGPIEDMTEDEAEDILEEYKEKFEDTWAEGWDDDNDGEVQFVIFTDDVGSIGTTGRTLRDITLDNGKLMSISICLVAIFSIILLISPDWIDSRVLITLIGVSLVVLAFFGSLGLAILLNIKINVSMAWTLPFIIIGIGVDDVYIVLMSLKKQGGYKASNFLRAMREVSVPVSMTSVVNCLMFAVLNISDIPAIYLTATVAVICVIALYLGVMFCFPAYCWLDMKRQAAGKRDFFFCYKANEVEGTKHEVHEDKRQVWLYEKFYFPLVLGAPCVRMVSHTFLILGALALFATGIYGGTQHEVGLGLEDFFPIGSQAQHWAETRTKELASWSIGMNWGAINYTDKNAQQKMIKQFEDVVGTSKVAEMNTDQLWMSQFLIWSTRHCTDNFDRPDPNNRICGMDQLFEGDGTEPDAGTVCAGGWMENKIGLRNKIIDDGKGDCEPYDGGICRPASQMFAEDLILAGHNTATDSNSTSYCPFVEWSDEKFQWCIVQFRNLTNNGNGRFILDSEATETECSGEFYKDEKLKWPIPFSAGPTMFSYDLFSHEETLDLLEQTRDFCDNNEELHCWMEGIPYDYWTQYENVFDVLIELSIISVAVGFGVAFLFLLGKIASEKRHSFKKVLCGTFGAALIIGATILINLIATIGLSVLAGVSLTGFSNMSFVLSVAFSVEYSVHIVSRWLRAPTIIESSLERVQYTMSFLMLPTFMAWISSTIGVICLAFTEFSFTEVFFFRPLIIVMMVTYFVGCFSLPAFLCYVDHDVFRLGKSVEESKSMVGSALGDDLKMQEGYSEESPGDEEQQNEGGGKIEDNAVDEPASVEDKVVDEPSSQAEGFEEPGAEDAQTEDIDENSKPMAEQ